MDFLGLGKTIDEAKKNAQDLVQVSLASVFGHLTNPGGLIPFTIKSLDDFVDRTLDKADKFIDKQLKKVKIG